MSSKNVKCKNCGENVEKKLVCVNCGTVVHHEPEKREKQVGPSELKSA